MHLEHGSDPLVIEACPKRVEAAGRALHLADEPLQRAEQDLLGGGPERFRGGASLGRPARDHALQPIEVAGQGLEVAFRG